MQAGEIGVPIQIFLNPQGATGPFSLLGQTCTLYVTNLIIGYTASFPMVVQPDGLSAVYITQAATDFPVGGDYILQMYFTQPSPPGAMRRTPEGTICVGGSET